MPGTLWWTCVAVALVVYLGELVGIDGRYINSAYLSLRSLDQNILFKQTASTRLSKSIISTANSIVVGLRRCEVSCLTPTRTLIVGDRTPVPVSG